METFISKAHREKYFFRWIVYVQSSEIILEIFVMFIAKISIGNLKPVRA